jgi:hypothetical protein
MLANGIEIERIEGSQIDDRRLDALGRESLGGVEDKMQLARISDDDQVSARAPDCCLAPGQWRRGKVDILYHRIERLVLDEDDGIGLGQRLAQQMVSIRNRGRHRQSEAWRVHDIGFKTLGMLGTRRPPGAALGSEHHGNADLAAEHVADFRRLIGKLVHRHAEEVDIHELGHWPQPRHRRPDGCADDGWFRDRRIEDAPGAELLEQILGHAIGAAIAANFFSHDDHIGIFGHRIGQCLAQRIAVSQLRHDLTPLQARG